MQHSQKTPLTLFASHKGLRFTTLLAALWLASVSCSRSTPERATAASATAASVGPAPREQPRHPQGQFPAKTPGSEAAPLHYLSFNLGGAKQEERVPLLIAIHGLGDSPRNFSRWLLSLDVKLRLIVPQAPDAYGHGFSWFPYREGRTEHELAEGIAKSRDRLEHLLTFLERALATRGKPAVIGFSQGGMLSFALAAHIPDQLSLVMPLGGLLPSELEPTPMAVATSRPEILAFHGVEDRVVPFAEAKRTTERLSSSGYSAHLTSYAGVGHQIPPPMRDAVFAKLKEWATQ